jgi:hypothetical protein
MRNVFRIAIPVVAVDQHRQIRSRDDVTDADGLFREAREIDIRNAVSCAHECKAANWYAWKPARLISFAVSASWAAGS